MVVLVLVLMVMLVHELVLMLAFALVLVSSFYDAEHPYRRRRDSEMFRRVDVHRPGAYFARRHNKDDQSRQSRLSGGIARPCMRDRARATVHARK